jgi:hypothetical protein
MTLTQAKINELRGALAEGRSDADVGMHSDGAPLPGDVMRTAGSFVR